LILAKLFMGFAFELFATLVEAHQVGSFQDLETQIHTQVGFKKLRVYSDFLFFIKFFVAVKKSLHMQMILRCNLVYEFAAFLQ